MNILNYYPNFFIFILLLITWQILQTLAARGAAALQVPVNTKVANSAQDTSIRTEDMGLARYWMALWYTVRSDCDCPMWTL